MSKKPQNEVSWRSFFAILKNRYFQFCDNATPYRLEISLACQVDLCNALQFLFCKFFAYGRSRSQIKKILLSHFSDGEKAQVGKVESFKFKEAHIFYIYHLDMIRLFLLHEKDSKYWDLYILRQTSNVKSIIDGA